MVGLGTIDVLHETGVSATTWPVSLAGPAETPVTVRLVAAASSLTVWSMIASNVGASLTAVTVTVTVATFETAAGVAESFTVYVKLSVPLKFRFGVYFTVPSALIATVPFVPWVTLFTVSVSPTSGSVSLARTLMLTAVSSAVVAV